MQYWVEKLLLITGFDNYILSGKKKVAVEEPATLQVKPVEPEPAPLAPAPGKLRYDSCIARYTVYSVVILLSEFLLKEIK